jgi:hypothetical protein
MRDPDLEILGHKRTIQAWFNVQSAGSEAGLLPDSVSESANLTVPIPIVTSNGIVGVLLATWRGLIAVANIANMATIKA